MITARMHQPVRAIAASSNHNSWITITDEDENDITIFLPTDKAKRIAAIINGEREPEAKDPL